MCVFQKFTWFLMNDSWWCSHFHRYSRSLRAHKCFHVGNINIRVLSKLRIFIFNHTQGRIAVPDTRMTNFPFPKIKILRIQKEWLLVLRNHQSFAIFSRFRRIAQYLYVHELLLLRVNAINPLWQRTDSLQIHSMLFYHSLSFSFIFNRFVISTFSLRSLALFVFRLIFFGRVEKWINHSRGNHAKYIFNVCCRSI